jgi:DNA primase
LETFLTKGVFDRSEFIAESDGKYENIIADIQMEDEKYTLDGWLEKKQVFVKSKDDDSQVKEHTIQTLYTYREFLLQKLMNNLMQDFLNNDDELIRNSIKEEVSDYVKLKTEISNTIKRVRTDYFKK